MGLLDNQQIKYKVVDYQQGEIGIIQAIFDKPLNTLPEISTKDKFEAQPGFTRLVLGTLNNGEFNIGQFLGSAMLRSLAHADGFAVCTNPPTQLRWLGLPL